MTYHVMLMGIGIAGSISLMSDWQSIESAPRDGTWILIRGEMSGGDTDTLRVARYSPNDDYQWQVIEYHSHDVFGHVNWYSEGRVFYWAPLGEPPSFYDAGWIND